MKTLKVLSLWLMVLLNNINIYPQIWTENPLDQKAPPDIYAAWRRGYFEGYTQRPSLIQGQTVEFKVSTIAAIVPDKIVSPLTCCMKIYRVSATNINDDIPMSSEIQFTGTFYPQHDKNHNLIWPEDSIYNFENGIYPVEYKKGCDWATSVYFSIPQNWQSGFYYAKLYLPGYEFDIEKVGYIPFVVKTSIAGSESKILFPIAWNTYQAYNYWGGGSLYWWTGYYDEAEEGISIETVSFRRPFGWHPYDCCIMSDQFGQLNQRERNMIAWAESNGYHMEYCVDSDLSEGSILEAEYKVVIFPGHSEYWDRSQRRNIENINDGFKGKGGNLIFLAANNCYWKVDYKAQSFPTDNPDSMYCYKIADESHPDGYNLWRYQEEGPEGLFIGEQFYGVNDINAHQYVENASHWIFRGTALSNNDAFGFGGPIASGESDMKRDEYSPANTILLARTLTGDSVQLYPYYGEDLYADMTYYEDIQTNSRVFASGGQGWSESFYGYDGDKIVTMTKNILDHFSMKKYIGNVYSDVLNPLKWLNNIQLDGYVNVLQGKGLLINGSALPITVTIDSILFVDGTVEVLENVTFDGDGSFNINPSGKLLLRTNSTLTVNSYFVLENGLNQITFEPGAKLIINNATLESGATLIVGSNGTLEVKAGSLVYAPGGSKIEVNGSLIANGSEQNKITFDFVEPDRDVSNGIIVNFGGLLTLSNTIVKNAYKGIKVTLGGQPSFIQNSTIQYCRDGIFIQYGNKDADLTVEYCEIKDNSNYGICIFNKAGYGMNSEPFISNNYIESCNYGMYLNGNVGALFLRNTIENCTQGIYVYEGQPSIMRNTILNPLQNGIYCTAPGKKPLILDNTIQKESHINSYHNYQGIWVENNTAAYIAHNDISGFYWGIYCGGGVNSYFSDYEFNDFYPNNRMRDNFFGFAAGWGSYIYAGREIGDGCWNNSIYENMNYDVKSYQYSYVMAQ